MKVKNWRRRWNYVLQLEEEKIVVKDADDRGNRHNTPCQTRTRNVLASRCFKLKFISFVERQTIKPTEINNFKNTVYNLEPFYKNKMFPSEDKELYNIVRGTTTRKPILSFVDKIPRFRLIFGPLFATIFIVKTFNSLFQSAAKITHSISLFCEHLEIRCNIISFL